MIEIGDATNKSKQQINKKTTTTTKQTWKVWLTENAIEAMGKKRSTFNIINETLRIYVSVCCPMREGLVATREKALLPHERRPCCHTREGLVATREKALLPHDR